MEGDNKDIVDANNAQLISIHALRVEGDSLAENCSIYLLVISIHALRVEGDCCREYGIYVSGEFLSTPSGWRATSFLVLCSNVPVFLSTPSGWRAT